MEYVITMVSHPWGREPIPYQVLTGRPVSLNRAYDLGWREITGSPLKGDPIGFLIHDDAGAKVGQWRMGDDDLW